MKKFLSSLLLSLTVLITASPAFATTVSCDNLLVEEFVEGDMIDGNPIGGANRIREEAFTPVQPSTTYYVQTTKSWHVWFYDADKNYLNAPSISSTNKSITTPANAYYLKVSSYPSYGTTYQNDLMISKYPITEYQPYNPLCATCQGIVKTYESATGTVTQNGTPTPANPIEPTFYQQGDMVLRKVGDVADSYDATTGKITRRVGVKVLDGTENWSVATTNVLQADVLPNNIPATNCISSHLDYTTSSTLANMPENSFRNGSAVYTDRLYVKSSTLATDETTWKNYLAQQYSAGTPVTVWYPLETPVEETVASTTYCADAIKIATTAYNTAAFAPVEAALESAVTTIKDVVANTIVQADAIQNLQDTKQTMPDANGTNGTCPKFRQCLLIETDDGTPQWFQIADPVYDLISSLKNNKVNSSGETTESTFAANGKTNPDSIYYNGYPAMRLKTSAQSSSVYTRQFSAAGLSGNQYKTLGDQEWAVTWDGDETGTANSFLPGVIYGTSRCVKTSEAPTTSYAAKVNPGTAGWTLVENSDALNDLENIESYVQCYCKMTGVGLDGMITPVRDSSAAPWVFYYSYGSAGNCALYCAYNCANDVRATASFRSAVLGFAAN